MRAEAGQSPRLLVIEAAALLLMALVTLFPSPLRFLVFLALPGLWLARRRVTGRFFERTPLDWPVLLLAVMLLVSVFATRDLAASLPKIAGLLLGIVVFYWTVALSAGRPGWRLGLSGFLGLAVALSAFSLVSTHWIDKFGPLAVVTNRLPLLVKGLPGAEEGVHPNEVAGALLWALPVLVMMLFNALRAGAWRVARAAPALWAAANGLTLGTFLLLQSRSGFLGLAAFAALAIVAGLSGFLRQAFIAGLVILGLAGAATVIRASATITDAAGARAFGQFMNGRLDHWASGIRGLQDYALTGMGLNQYRYLVPELYPTLYVSTDIDRAHAHNELLQAGLDLGVPGLAAFVGLLVGGLWMCASLWRSAGSSETARIGWRGPNGEIQALALGLGGGLVAHAAYGLTDAVALGAKPGILFWMLLGLIVGLFKRQEL